MPTELDAIISALDSPFLGATGIRPTPEELHDAMTSAAKRLRPIAAALQAQQPGAQAVAWRYARPPEEGCTEETHGPWNTIYPDSDVAFYARATKEQGCRIEYAYLGQPPSIPEPSEEESK